jgi:low temperature requirement protein LtrA
MSMTERVGRHASWLELFYDLLFVALFAQLAHGLVDDPGVASSLRALGLFAPAWWVWVSATVSSNLYGEWGAAHRLLTLTSMGCLLLMTAGVASALDGDPALYAAGFAATRVALLVLVAVWAQRHPGAERPTASYVCYSLSATLWAASIPLGPPAGYVLWAVALAVELGVRIHEQAASRRRHAARPWDVELLVERFGLLMMVALGEGVVQIATSMSHTDPAARVVVSGLVGFGIVATLWWGYFDFAAGPATDAFDPLEARPDHDRAVYRFARDTFIFGHFFLVGSVVAAAAGIGAVVHAAVAGEGTAPGDLRLLADALALYLVTGAVLALRAGADPRRTGLATAALLAALGAIALAAGHLAPPVGLAAVAVVLLAGRLDPARP